MTGTIRQLSDRGFGFLSADGAFQDNIFFHLSQLRNAQFHELRIGLRVEFDQLPNEGARPGKAQNVRVIP